MRTIRGWALVPALVAFTPLVAAAQAERQFNDSWFWGAKVGALAFSTTRIENGFAPSIGAEWLITRNKGALYVSLDRSFFSEQSTVSSGQSFTGEQLVNVRDLTRLSFSLLAFPKQYDNLRPYGGVGLALNFIQRAAPADGFGDSGAIEEQRSRASFQLLAGVQAQLETMSVFGQVAMLPFESNFLLNGRSAYALEFGLRFNVGSAISDIR
jgi:opacity protein-like surface antigen